MAKAKAAPKKTTTKNAVEDEEVVVEEKPAQKTIEPKTKEYTHGPWQGHDPDGIQNSITQYIAENNIAASRIISRTVGYTNEKSCYEGWITYEITE